MIGRAEMAGERPRLKVSVAVLTFNPIHFGRVDLLDATLASVAEADQTYLIDNGSTDGFVLSRAVSYRNESSNTNCAHGTNLQARVLAASDADICVLSDDDMLWRPGWRDRLEAWWQSAPSEVLLTGCHIEAEFPWNEITGVVEGSERALKRKSTGAASWSFRRSSIPQIFPIPEKQQGHGDVPACERLIDMGYQICQLDLAEHVGEVSTWGNRTAELFNTDPSAALARLA